MTGRPPRIVAPDDQPTPRVENDTTIILTEAVDTPAAPRTTYCLGDSTVHLHTLPSLTAQPQLLLPSAIHPPRAEPQLDPRPANCSTSHQLPQPDDTRTTNDQLDEDHPHNAAVGRTPAAAGGVHFELVQPVV